MSEINDNSFFLNSITSGLFKLVRGVPLPDNLVPSDSCAESRSLSPGSAATASTNHGQGGPVCDPQKTLPPLGEYKLKRGIRPWMANRIAIGGIIGSAYFIGTVYLISQLGPSVILIYAIGGLIIWTVMQSFAELLVNVPRQGNFISYS